jgi:hypothetical protein
MKALVCALALVAGVLAGEARAEKSIFDQLNETAPRSSVFEDLNLTAPKSVWDQINETAPRSDGVFGDLERTAP